MGNNCQTGFRMLVILTAWLNVICTLNASPAEPLTKVRGWNILSDYREDAITTIKAAGNYSINHLQLSHDLVMDMKELRDSSRKRVVNDLIDEAHEAGIKEVVLWDHALYSLSYYPDKFRTGPDSTLDLDNEEFWNWFRDDYRKLMNLAPMADGIVLTFIETGARAERQHSVKYRTGPEKLAAVVDAVADIVCNERGKRLYIRTFAYTEAEYENTIGCIKHIRSRDIILMMKETPHDFFLTHPNDRYAGTLDRPVIIEFDCGNEFHGQGVVANTWPEYIMKRCSDLLNRKNVIGYVARTDRYRNTRVVGTANEINLYALKRYCEDNSVSAEQIYDEFITLKYGEKHLSEIKSAFKSSYDIISSVFYTLGTNLSNHSKMDFDPYKSSYGRHVSGKWINPPVVTIRHDVNRDFHYWTDIIEHIAPARFKESNGPLKTEAPFVIDNNWVSPVEMMDEEYLRYIIKEKRYGVKRARQAYSKLVKIEPGSDDLRKVAELFYRTLLTAEMYEAVSTAYFGYRVYARGEEYKSRRLHKTISSSLEKMMKIADEIENYEGEVPRGEWNWRGDAATARKYYNLITSSGWKEYNNTIFKK
jgi:hypothetical protein